MKFIVLFLIMILVISTIVKIKYSRSLGITNAGSLIKIILLPAVFCLLVIGALLYFF